MVVGQSEFSGIERRRLIVSALHFVAEAEFQHPVWTLWAMNGHRLGQIFQF
jgi:hypothetical protein